MKMDLQKILNSRLFNMFLSLVIAVVAWVIVVTTVYPEGEQVIKSVPVNFQYNSSAYTASGLDIVSAPAMTVDIRVRGKRSYINNLSADNFLVYPNYTPVHGAGEYQLKLQIKVQDNNWESSQATIVNDKSLPEATVVFDTVITKSFAISTDTSGLQIADGYIFDKAQCSPTEVTLKGPEGYVEGERKESVTQSSTLIAVDENGKKLDLKYVSFSSEIAEVTLSIQQRKELPLKVEFTNVPSGFDISTLQNRVKLSKTSLTVSGDSRKLDGLSELVVAYFDVSTFAFLQIPPACKLQTGIFLTKHNAVPQRLH